MTAPERPAPVPAGPADAAPVPWSGEGFSIPGNPSRRMKELAASGVLGVMSVLVAFPPSHEYWLTWFTLPMMVLGAVHFGRRAADPSPRVVVDAEGVTDRTSIFGGTLHLPWDEILSVAPARWQNAVELQVRDLPGSRARLGWGRRLESLVNRVFGKKTLSIDLTLLGVGKQELASRIETALLAAEREVLGLDPERPEVTAGDLPT